MIEFIKSLFSKKSAEDIRVESFKKVAEKCGYTVRAIYRESNKISIVKDDVLIVISIESGSVVTTLGNSKLKRFNLTDDEIKMVIIDPKVKIKDRKFMMI